METYAKALLYAIPFFVILVLAEIGYGHFVKKQKHRAFDTISSLSSGLTNIIKDSLGLVLIIVSYPYILEQVQIFSLGNGWLMYVSAFIAMDFASYWNHRLSHHVNFFWNQHVIHHSSEEFNLACALRQSISNLLGYFPLLLLPAAIVGVPHEVISLIAPIHLFAQFWYHTQHIGKLGVLEYIIVTPSQHRVHHAINEEYLDKNLAAIFCVWDRMFGTFQEELEDVPPVYGVLKPAQTWNPFIINFQHIWLLIKDAWRTKSFWDKMRIWFMPTGWRPEDVKEAFPVQKIDDPFQFDKYETNPSKLMIYWSVFRLIMTTVLMLFMFFNYSEIGLANLLLYGLIIGLGIFAYTSLMDRNPYAMIPETLSTVIGLVVIINTQDWFGLNAFVAIGCWLVSAYFLSSFIVSLIYSLEFLRERKTQVSIPIKK